ncbi:MAG TPA: ribonuclease P protein component [Saprospiraceae bacterium]|nr:ribonuclease P protein component [Saprospiraceae bacterium]MCB9270810.1 ribonuclease P protein component [Lewinellaceae bacterium]HPG05820.1 ribonuclease P protein component [Saprospiraceae bacterium]HPQ99511.1 ribonuclease P protein component [Saprospiraceae bacterium]HQU52723.1 ribonuclease P protein component [Saprospiraceae bacterium]
MPDLYLGSNRRLKHRKLITRLFKEGHSLFNYPFKLLWLPVDDVTGSPFLFSVSVPKKTFPKAVDRNRLKRQTRESFRLQQQQLTTIPGKTILLMYIYVGKEALAYDAIDRSIRYLTKLLKKSIRKSAPSDV